MFFNLFMSGKVFPLSPLIRITLISLYFALTLPLPFLSDFTQAPISGKWLWLGIGLGAIALVGALSERVTLDDARIQVSYAQWVPSFFRRGWSLNWQEIKHLKMRTTGQGGLVYYFICENQTRAYLLPMRVAGFARMIQEVEAKTGIDTRDIKPLAQPWMYLILLLFTTILLLIDLWTITTAINFQIL